MLDPGQHAVSVSAILRHIAGGLQSSGACAVIVFERLHAQPHGTVGSALEAHQLCLQVHAALAAAKPANPRLPIPQPQLADPAGHRLAVGSLLFLHIPLECWH